MINFFKFSFSPSMPCRSNGGVESVGLSYWSLVRIGTSLSERIFDVFVARSRNCGAWRRVLAPASWSRFTQALTGRRGERMNVVYPSLPRPKIVTM